MGSDQSQGRVLRPVFNKEQQYAFVYAHVVGKLVAMKSTKQ